MNDKFFIQQPIRPISQPLEKKQDKRQLNQGQDSFKEVFEKQIIKDRNVKFSKHAQERLSLRKIVLNQDSITKLNVAINQVAEKGAKESLVLMNDLAFIVSVPNKTVITALSGESIKQNVFTNIDSAVII